MKIYLASSWRNARQPEVLATLQAEGHQVYDFRNPAPGDDGFAWSDIEPNWLGWDAEAFRNGLEHPIAQAGFERDMNALRECDACVMLLPCGRSAHIEAGWAAGAGKRTFVLMEGQNEPELMYLMVDAIATSLDELVMLLVASENGMRTYETPAYRGWRP